jgi:Tfp pilus assembly protein PilF
VTYFQKAVEADPKYARAYAMLSDAYNMLGYYGFADPYEMMKKSSDAANKALELDERLPETYVALAYLKRFERDGGPKAKQLLEKAIEIGPFNSTARVRYAWILVAEGDLDGSVQQMRLAQEYDPLSVVSNGALCSVLIWQGKSEEGIKYCERSVEISPDMQNSKVALAEAYFAAGRHGEAIALAEKVVAATEGNERLEALGSLGYFHAKIGRKKDAEKAMAEISPHISQSPYLLDNLIVINYALGKKEEGFAAFEQLAGRRGVTRFRVIFDPAWADVRADERVMKRLNES